MIAITGSTSGIGFEIAKQYCKEKKNILLIGNNQKKLNEQKSYFERRFKVPVEILATDLSQTSSVKNIFWEIKRQNYIIDTFINCAGIGIYGDFTDTPIDMEIKMLRINAEALTILTKDAIEYFKAKKIKGKILNVTADYAMLPTPYMAVFGATKSYVKNFSQAVNKELKEAASPIIVSTLFVPATNTQFITKTKCEESGMYKEYLYEPKKVASKAIKGLNKKRENIYISFSLRLLGYGLRILPNRYQLMYINMKLRRR